MFRFVSPRHSSPPPLHHKQPPHRTDPLPQHKPQNLITLFHNPHSASSIRIHSLLKSLNSPSPTNPSSSSPPAASSSPSTSPPFKLDVQTAPPTPSQATSIWEFLQAAGSNHALGELVKGAKSVGDLERLLGVEVEEGGKGEGKTGGENGDRFVRPVVVDWGNGRVVVGGDERGVRGLVEGLDAG